MPAAIIHLGRSLPNGSSSLPENAVCLSASTGTGRSLIVSLFGLAPRGVYLAERVTTFAGELLPHRFTHHRRGGWFILCCTCRHVSKHVPGRYPARCPLVFGLSSPIQRSDHPARSTAWLCDYSKKLLNTKGFTVRAVPENPGEINAAIFPVPNAQLEPRSRQLSTRSGVFELVLRPPHMRFPKRHSIPHRWIPDSC